MKIEKKSRIGVAAVVIDEYNRILLIQRGQAPSRGMWSLPGGKQEYRESLENTCIREVLEETGIEVVPIEIIAVAERIDNLFHYVIIDFIAKTSRNNTTLKAMAQTDALDAKWLQLRELGDYPLADGVLPVIKKALEIWHKTASGGLKRQITTLSGPGDYLP